MRILIIILISLLHCLIHVHAQNSLSVGVQVSPTFSSIVNNTIYRGFQYQGNLNFGATVDFKSKKWGISSGISRQKLGSKFEVEKINEIIQEGTGEFYDVNIHSKSIAIPIRLYYIIPLSNRYSISPMVGIMPGYIYSQTIEVPEYTVLPPYKAVSDIEMFNQFYVAVYAGASIRRQINETWSVEVIPGFSYQYGKESVELDDPSRPALMVFSVEFGMKYKLR